MAVAIRTEGLSKRYGSAVALAPLDLEVAQGEGFGYLGPNGAGKADTISLLSGSSPPTSGGAEIFGMDAQRDPAEVHGRVAYVPADSNLWPSMTGAEVMRFLGNIHGRVDVAYRDELI